MDSGLVGHLQRELDAFPGRILHAAAVSSRARTRVVDRRGTSSSRLRAKPRRRRSCSRYVAAASRGPSRRQPARRVRPTTPCCTPRPSPIRRSRAARPRRATSSTSSAARSSWPASIRAIRLPCPPVAQGERAVREAQLVAPALDLGEGGLGAGEIALEEPNAARCGVHPGHRVVRARTTALRSSGHPMPIECGRGRLQAWLARCRTRRGTWPALPSTARWPPRYQSGTSCEASQRLDQLGRSVQIAARGVVAPQRTEGRVQLGTRPGRRSAAGTARTRRRPRCSYGPSPPRRGTRAPGERRPPAGRAADRLPGARLFQCAGEVVAGFVECAASVGHWPTLSGGPMPPRRNARLARSGVRPAAIPGPRRPPRDEGVRDLAVQSAPKRWAARARRPPRAEARGGSASCLCLAR